jgi:pimeloyl-ACP methyl ester carboxylesterase
LPGPRWYSPRGGRSGSLVGEDATVITTPPHHDGFVDVDGLRLHHVEHASAHGGRVPLVLLHGVTGHATVWSDVAARLGGTRRVIALDMRGFGDSQWSPTSSYATTEHADDVVGVLDALGIARVDVVGSSWGALVAIAVASRAADRVARLGLVDIEPSFAQGETELMPRPRSFATHDAAVAHEAAANPHADRALLDLVVAAGTRSDREGSLVPKHDPFFFERWPFRSDNWWDALPQLSAPTLVVRAGESFVREEVTQRMAAALPDGHHVEIPGSTHVVPIDAPGPLAAALAAFLE